MKKDYKKHFIYFFICFKKLTLPHELHKLYELCKLYELQI